MQSEWLPPLLRQLRDPLGLASAARSRRSARLRPRTAGADRVVQSVCPYCAVGCGQRVYVEDGRVVQIEGDPDSPISLERPTDMIAERLLATRAETWEDRTDEGELLNRTLGVAFLGGATLDTEENYLIKKLLTAAGVVSVENQTRI